MRPARILQPFAVVVALGTAACAHAVIETAVQSTTPEAAVRAYVNSLVSGNMIAFWAHDFGYNFDVEVKTANLPKTMWNQQIEGIKRARLSELAQDRNARLLGPFPWQALRPGATAEVLETRKVLQSQSSPPAWQAFVKVRYPSESQAPLGLLNDIQRPVKEVTISLQVVQRNPQDKRILVSKSEVVPGSTSFWSISYLTQQAALEMAKRKIPVPSSRIEVSTDGSDWNVPVIEDYVLSTISSTRVKQLEQIISVLGKHGVQVKNPRIERGSHVSDGLVLPESWKPFYLGKPRSWEKIERYALSQSFDVTLLSNTFRQGPGTAEAMVQVSYRGCTPICALYQDLLRLNNPYGNVVFPEYGSDNLRTTFKKQVYFTWDVARGWEVTHVEDVWGQ